ncbi:hypothetical protein B7494_g472 [Chlorociboria aeruginascens]|nr:hypothetical protein B7494_g472 [Chlorociboria aeruginascens]
MQLLLPTPSTSHVAFDRIYEPAEDSYLLLDTLSCASEKAFLRERFSHARDTSSSSSSPFVVEVGTGSGVVLAFMHAYAESIVGRADILTAGIDINRFACEATEESMRVAEGARVRENQSHGLYVGNMVGDLTGCLRGGVVDVLIFNPPYVPTEELPRVPEMEEKGEMGFEADSNLLALSYAGGKDGMEITDRLLDCLPLVLSQERGCAYILLCAQNKPEIVKQRIRDWGLEWRVETVGRSGKKAGWEKLQIIRIWRVPPIK